MSSDAIRLREERLRRNAAMLQQVMGAAEELADVAATEEQIQAEVAMRKAQERQKRFREEAARLGPRKSTRRSTQAAARKIAQAFQSGSESSSGGAPSEHAAVHVNGKCLEREAVLARTVCSPPLFH